MEHSIKVADYEIKFGDPDRAKLEKFASSSQAQFLAFTNIQVFLKNIQLGKIDNYVKIGEKQEQAFNELERMLLEMASDFYNILSNSSAFINGEMISREKFDEVFNWDSLDSGNRLQEAVTAFVSELSVTMDEVKN